MSKSKIRVGREYEQQAALYLEQQGLTILCRNFSCRFGEVDLIARDLDDLVFCEVKYRRSNQHGSSLEAVDRRKQQRISKTAQYYLYQQHLNDINVRFDVIGIDQEQIRWIRNAFDYYR